MENNFKKGDKVEIIHGPDDKVGKVGEISTLAENGALIQFPDGSGTAVRFVNLRKVADADKPLVRPPESAGKIFGILESRDVFIDGVFLTPEKSLQYRNHSPDGFAWGYGGSGPAQLALAVLLHLAPDPEFAQRHYQEFKFAFIATAPKDSDLEIDVEEAMRWIAEKI